ncbi:MAG: nickel pincer cofactor biosynthesis protein LarC, partial [Clostridia bacterium]|nr:nickel pincer cofactor biosynthesis protein LarC [Clostridia bacterium]
MRTLFLDCGMGAAGDMLSAALWELLPEKEKFIEKLNAAGIPSVKFSLQKAEKCGVVGCKLTVSVGGEIEGEDHHEHHHDHHHEHEHEHHHSGMSDIRDIVSALFVDESVKNDILSVYDLIAKAESEVHGKSVDKIHFHEVGDKDAIADITAFCMLVSYLKVDEIVVSPVATGYGEVKCAHGILPVPAPATANIIKGMPVYAGEIKGELLTPTGAALLKRFATRFSSMPEMAPSAVGYGMGSKDFERANCVRAILGETINEGMDEIVELSCNVDDMTAEEIAFSCEALFEAGALEVFSYPVNMKKSRYGSIISVFCAK